MRFAARMCMQLVNDTSVGGVTAPTLCIGMDGLVIASATQQVTHFDGHTNSGRDGSSGSDARTHRGTNSTARGPPRYSRGSSAARTLGPATLAVIAAASASSMNSATPTKVSAPACERRSSSVGGISTSVARRAMSADRGIRIFPVASMSLRPHAPAAKQQKRHGRLAMTSGLPVSAAAEVSAICSG